MIKPPKTALLAAVVAAGVGCKTGNQPFPPGAVGTVAQPIDEPAPEIKPDSEPHKVGKTAAPDPQPKPIQEPVEVGKVAAPDIAPHHKVGTVARPHEPKIEDPGTAANPRGEEGPPGLPKPKPPEDETSK